MDFSFLFNVRIDSVEKLDGQVGGTVGWQICVEKFRWKIGRKKGVYHFVKIMADKFGGKFKWKN